MYWGVFTVIIIAFVRFLGQAVKTSPSHGENRGSIPLGTATVSNNSPTRRRKRLRFLFLFPENGVVMLCILPGYVL